MEFQSVAPIAAVGVGFYLCARLLKRLQLSLAKHPSLRGHAKWSRRLARLVPYYALSHEAYFSCDGAPPDIAEKRRTALQRLARCPKVSRCPGLSNWPRPSRRKCPTLPSPMPTGFPFPFGHCCPSPCADPLCSVHPAARRSVILDGNWRHDLSGSYGVNVFGYDFYKSCIEEANDYRPAPGTRFSGPYHPIVADNAERLAKLAGLDEVSFHMSGTEAVMQAVRLARYHTGRSHLVRFCGAYHGWWDGVQPGVGNERRVDDVYTLADMSERSLRMIASRKDIACVLVNPFRLSVRMRMPPRTADCSGAGGRPTSTAPHTPTGCIACGKPAAAAAWC
jgi:glutamate-1-semialdehyde 2,1-aminomutase